MQQARDLSACIETSDIVGRRDRAIIAVMVAAAVRAGANAKLRNILCRYDLQKFMQENLTAAGGDTGEDAPTERAGSP